jgi:hypothetical protein
MRVFWPQAVAGPWTAKQIHDTVAAIARERRYAASSESIAGRIAEAIFRWLRDLFRQAGTWPGLRYVLIAAAIVLILAIAGRIVIEERMQARRAAGFGLRALDVETRDYWALAVELDAAGRHVEACHAVYVAVLAALARAGTLRFHASKTSGDYARELRQRGSPQAADFTAFVRQFERAVYGWNEPTHDGYVGLARAGATLALRRAAA